MDDFLGILGILGEAMKFLELEHNGKIIRLWAEKRGSQIWVHFNHRNFLYEEPKKEKTKSSRKKSSKGKGVITAPMPGKIVKTYAREGDEVETGQVVIVMEAMKMEYRLCADISGKIEKLSCKEGDSVSLGQSLALIKGDPH